MADATAAAGVAAGIRRDGDALVLSGALLRPAVSGLWLQAAPLRAGARRLQLSAVSALDSAGLALLVELAEPGLDIHGAPPGLDELRAAYRLDEALRLAR